MSTALKPLDGLGLYTGCRAEFGDTPAQQRSGRCTMDTPETEWQVIHEPRDCFDLIIIHVEAKRWSVKNI